MKTSLLWLSLCTLVFAQMAKPVSQDVSPNIPKRLVWGPVPKFGRLFQGILICAHTPAPTDKMYLDAIRKGEFQVPVNKNRFKVVNSDEEGTFKSVGIGYHEWAYFTFYLEAKRDDKVTLSISRPAESSIKVWLDFASVDVSGVLPSGEQAQVEIAMTQGKHVLVVAYSQWWESVWVRILVEGTPLRIGVVAPPKAK